MATRKALPWQAIGAAGYVQSSGYLAEGYVPELRGEVGRKTLERMAKQSAPLAGAVYLVGQQAKRADWGVEPAGHPRGAEAADLLESALYDMESPWEDWTEETMRLAVTFGWAASEPTYKLRAGYHPDVPGWDSRHADNRIGLRDLGQRHPLTLDRWDVDDAGQVRELIQRAAPDYRERRIPIERLVLHQIRANKGSPEGLSLLEGAYRAWYRVTTAEDLELIGLERNVAGMVVLEVPPEDLTNADAYNRHKRFVRQLRVNELMGAVIPSEEVRGQKTGYKLSLLSAAGTQASVADPIIRREVGMMLSAFGAEYIRAGMDGVGARSFAETKLGALASATHGHLLALASTINRQIVPELMQVNGFPPESWPYLTVARPSDETLAELATFITAGVTAGIIAPQDGDEDWWRAKADMPARIVDTNDDNADPLE